MQLLFFAALSLLVLLASLTQSEGARVDAPQAAADARRQLDQYRSFMFFADQYMLASAPTAPGVVTVDWPTIAQSAAVPPAARAFAMPAGWRVVRAADFSWVACTPMEEGAAGAVAQLVPTVVGSDGNGRTFTVDTSSVSLQLPNAQSGTASFVVVGSPTAALSLAALCNS